MALTIINESNTAVFNVAANSMAKDVRDASPFVEGVDITPNGRVTYAEADTQQGTKTYHPIIEVWVGADRTTPQHLYISSLRRTSRRAIDPLTNTFVTLDMDANSFSAKVRNETKVASNMTNAQLAAKVLELWGKSGNDYTTRKVTKVMQGKVLGFNGRDTMVSVMTID